MVALYRRRPDCDDDALTGELGSIVREAYVEPQEVAAWLGHVGLAETAARIAARIPAQGTTSRYGDFAEALASVYARAHLGFPVPVWKLRWKDGRNVPMHGDDGLGLELKPDGTVSVLRIEAKSYRILAKAVLDAAYVKLGKDDFFPDPDTVAFQARRLSDQPELKTAIEDLQANARGQAEIALMIFALYENAGGDAAVVAFAAERPDGPNTAAVGLHLPKRGTVTDAAYDAALELGA